MNVVAKTVLLGSLLCPSLAAAECRDVVHVFPPSAFDPMAIGLLVAAMFIAINRRALEPSRNLQLASLLLLPNAFAILGLARYGMPAGPTATLMFSVFVAMPLALAVIRPRPKGRILMTLGLVSGLALALSSGALIAGKWSATLPDCTDATTSSVF